MCRPCIVDEVLAGQAAFPTLCLYPNARYACWVLMNCKLGPNELHVGSLNLRSALSTWIRTAALLACTGLACCGSNNAEIVIYIMQKL